MNRSSLQERPYPSIDSRSPILDYALPTKNGPVSIGELAERFYASDFAIQMRQQALRFSARHGYERQQMLDDGGKDYCPIGHQEDSLRFFEQLIDSEQASQTLLGARLDEPTIAKIGFMLLIHDIGESEHPIIQQVFGRTLGDKPAGTKTDSDKQLEAGIRSFFANEMFFDIDDELWQELEDIMSHQSEDSFEHAIYEAVHNLQSLDTVERAEATLAAIPVVFGPEEQRTIALESLITSVRPTVTSHLDGYRELSLVKQSLARQPKADRYEHFVTADNIDYHRQCVRRDCQLAVIATTAQHAALLATR